MTLLEHGDCLFVGCIGGIKSCFGQCELRTSLLERLLASYFGGACQIDLIDGDKLLCQQRLETLEVVTGVGKFCLGPLYRGFGIAYVSLRLIDGGARPG